MRAQVRLGARDHRDGLRHPLHRVRLRLPDLGPERESQLPQVRAGAIPSLGWHDSRLLPSGCGDDRVPPHRDYARR